MKKKILHLGAGELMINNILLLKEAGYEIYLLDKNPNAPAFAFADGFEAIDVVNAVEVLAYAKKINADAIMAVNDAAVQTAAYASSKLNLIYHTVVVAEKCTDKGLMRQSWEEKKLSQPAFKIVHSAEEIRKAVSEIGLPCILKPCLNWGSKGVSVINAENDIDWAIDFALNNNRNDRFIVEEFIPGLEVTIEGLVQNSKASILARSDKEHQDHPKYKVAMALNYPARLSEKVQATLDKLIYDAIEALGIENGAFHAECMIRDEEVFLVEMGGRPGGGHIFGYIVEAVSGICMPVALAKILLGEKISIEPLYQQGACYRFFNAAPGIFSAINNLTEAKNSEGILDMGFNLKPGTNVGAISGDADRPGYIVSKGIDRDQAITNATNALSKISFA